jgi:hypothetical protein
MEELKPIAIVPPAASGAIQFPNGVMGRPFTTTQTTLALYEGSYGGRKTELGIVVVAPQVPKWMSPHYPDVVAAERSGGPSLSEYGREWFERIVYVEEKDKLDPAKAAWTEGLAMASTLLQTPYSRGCSRGAPMVRIANPFAPVASETKLYHALVTAYYDEHKAQPVDIKEIGLLPIVTTGRFMTSLSDRLKDFVATDRHTALRMMDPPDEATMEWRERRQP